MITTKQEKNKTTIIIPRRLKKSELNSLLNFISLSERAPRKKVTKKQIMELSNEINAAAWEKFKKIRGIE